MCVCVVVYLLISYNFIVKDTISQKKVQRTRDQEAKKIIFLFCWKMLWWFHGSVIIYD